MFSSGIKPSVTLGEPSVWNVDPDPLEMSILLSDVYRTSCALLSSSSTHTSDRFEASIVQTSIGLIGVLEVAKDSSELDEILIKSGVDCGFTFLELFESFD